MRYMLFGWMFFAFACCSNGAEHPSRTLNSSAFDPTRLNYADLVATIGALRIAGTRNDGDYFFGSCPLLRGFIVRPMNSYHYIAKCGAIR